MKRTAVVACLVALLFAPACGSVGKVKAPGASDATILKASENLHIYKADYDTTFRAALDALRSIDNNSAKYVKYSKGRIVFKKPDNSGTISAIIEKVDEETTSVELTAKNRRKYWIDSGDKNTTGAFFAELDRLLGLEKPESDTDVKKEPQPPKGPDKGPLLSKLAHELNLADENFLDRLSYEELLSLDLALQPYRSLSSENQNLSSRCATCYVDLARIYHNERRYDRATDALKIAVSIDPDSAVAHCNLGEIYKHLGLYDEAIRELEEAKRLDPQLADIYINLGIIYDDFEANDKKALENYRKYLELGGTDKQVLEWIDAIEKGS